MSTLTNDLKFRIGQATHPLALDGLAQELKFAPMTNPERREVDSVLAERFENLSANPANQPAPLGEWVNEAVATAGA